MAVHGAVFAALGLAMFVGTVAAAEKAPTLEMFADGEVQIAVDGHVSDYRLTSTMAPEIATLIDKTVRGWTFEPIVVDGAPVIAKTAMHLDLKAEPSGEKDQYRLRIANVRFGDMRRGFKARPPHYPMEAVRVRLGAKVLVAIRVDESGNVVDAQAYQTSLDAKAGSENEAERWRKMFEAASIVAARGWHYDVPESINGKPVGSTAIVPVDFFVSDVGTHPAPGTWRAYVPGPIHDVPWMASQKVADNRDLANLPDGQALTVDSRFRLRDDVVGKAL